MLVMNISLDALIAKTVPCVIFIALHIVFLIVIARATIA